jgi:hypothetical protein
VPRDLIREAETAAPLDADGVILERAAEIIEQRGWATDTDGIGHPERPICAVHAIFEAVTEEYAPEFDHLSQADISIRLIRRCGFKSGPQMGRWNDARSYAAEVIARLRAGARGQL